MECLVELGHSGTTTLAVQARAGVTRGSLLHQFPSRVELLVAAMTHLAEARFAALVEQVEASDARENRLDAAVEAMWESAQGPLFVAATELWVAARTHPELQAVLEPAEHDLGKHFRAGWAELLGPFSRRAAFPELFDLLTSSMRGVALTHNFDRSKRRNAAYLRLWKRLAHDLLDDPPRPAGRRP